MQLIVNCSNETTAIVEYSSLRPFTIQYPPHYEAPGYRILWKGDSLPFSNKDEVLAWLESIRKDLISRPAIRSIKFMKDRYARECTKISGSDFYAIHAAINDVDNFQYDDAESMFDDLVEQLDY